MLDRAGLELAAQAKLAGLDAVLARVVEAVDRGIASRAGQRQARQRVVLAAPAHAHSGPAGPLLVEVVFSAHGTEQVAAVGVGPGLSVVGLAVRSSRNGQIARRCQRGTRRRQLVLLPAQIGRQACTAAAQVQAQRTDSGVNLLAAHAGAAAAPRKIQAHTGCIIGAEAASHISSCVGLPATGAPQGHTIERLVARTLGHHIDEAAQTATADAAGARAAEKGIRSAKHLHTLHELRRHVLARHQPVQAVVGHIIGIQHKAAHEVGLLEIAEAARRAHAGIVEQHIAHALGLLILNQIAGVAGGGKRGLHHVLVSQHADTRAARHLPTRKRLGQTQGRSIGAGLHGHGLQGSF